MTMKPMANILRVLLLLALTVGATMTALAQDGPTQVYVQNAIMCDLFEVKAGEIVAERSHNPKVKNFAKMMIRDHQASSETIGSGLATAKLDVLVPIELDATHATMLQALRDAPLERFVAVYLDQQEAGHDAALTLHADCSETGGIPELCSAAGSIAKVVEHHQHSLASLGR